MEQGEPAPLTVVRRHHRDRAEPPAPPRKIKRQAGGTELPAAGTHDRELVRLLTGDAGAVIGVRGEDRRRHLEHTALVTWIEETVRVKDVRPPCPDRVERPGHVGP